MLKYEGREGFSLVEVLIVIIIIAILAGLLAISMSGSQENVDVGRLINSIRTIKSAYIACYADTHKYLLPNDGAEASSDLVASLEKYAGKSLAEEIHDYGPITIQQGTNESIYIGFVGSNDLKGRSSASKIYAELLRRANAFELKGKNGDVFAVNGPILMRVK